MRNTSATGCQLNGWPGLVFFGENVVDFCLPPRNRDPLVPATCAVLWTIGAGDFCKSDKQVLYPFGVHILVPGDSQPLTQYFDNTNSPQLCDQTVQVTAFGAAG